MAVHSVCCCAPYLATEKPQRRFRSMGVQPMVGTVSSTSPPVDRVSSMKWSEDELFGSSEGFGWAFSML